ncbi:MAG: hypothetical protein L0Z54_02705 [Thermoplasmata archaeon]|nr:hypothetical protein [Thermoplasmata archaeon]
MARRDEETDEWLGRQADAYDDQYPEPMGRSQQRHPGVMGDEDDPPGRPRHHPEAGGEGPKDIDDWLGSLTDKFGGERGELPVQKQLGYTGEDRDYRVEAPRAGAMPKVWLALAIVLAALALLLDALLPGVDDRFVVIARVLLLPVVMFALVMAWRGGGAIGRSAVDRLTRWVH